MATHHLHAVPLHTGHLRPLAFPDQSGRPGRPRVTTALARRLQAVPVPTTCGHDNPTITIQSATGDSALVCRECVLAAIARADISLITGPGGAA